MEIGEHEPSCPRKLMEGGVVSSRGGDDRPRGEKEREKHEFKEKKGEACLLFSNVIPTSHGKNQVIHGRR